MSKRDFLVEIGTEELPPKSLLALAETFRDQIRQGLQQAGVDHGDAQWFATPRRLATLVHAVSDRQPDSEIKRQGPAIFAAFDANGEPTKAALGFAASCGVTIAELGRAEGPKGQVLQYVGVKKGRATAELLSEIVRAALGALPIAKRMRWGAGDQEFVRPVHWVVLLYGSTVVDAEILGVRTGKHSRGHRFHAPQAIAIRNPASYCELLLSKGRVVADADQRRNQIRAGVEKLAAEVGGEAIIEPALLDEVTALVELPVPIAGQFEAKYLDLPAEIPIAAMQGQQRYFPVRDQAGKLLNRFITVANIESRDPEKVRDGNERVVRPRLADAAFFWDMDRKQKLADRRDALRAVTFQGKLGSLYDKSERVGALAKRIADAMQADPALTLRAAQLYKCDLLTLMVGEFPELQGLMGRYYAQHDGESVEVCNAIEQQYWPRFAGDRLPEARVSIALSIADKLDTIAGIFCIGQKPSGTRDPFGLRRAALGVLRTMIERQLDLDLLALIESAVVAQPVTPPDGVVEEIWSYTMERLRSMYLEAQGERAVTTEMFDAVLASKPHSPLDIDIRLRALQTFLALPEADSLASANKRIANILRKAASDELGAVDVERLQEPAERQLFEHVLSMERAVNPLFARREYAGALTQLAMLRENIDRFFETVMVMAEDAEVRANRLGLLVRLRRLFLQVADLSQLPG
jgi:glycyl-tRNA synthetase beta chain